jgi:hypothetical protein
VSETSGAATGPNEAHVAVVHGPLVGAVLGRVVGMLAARAQCPIDRLDDALLITDAVAAHAPEHTVDGRVVVTVEASEERLELEVGPLRENGALALVAEAALPGVGNVLERVADEVRTGTNAEGEELAVRLAFNRVETS